MLSEPDLETRAPLPPSLIVGGLPIVPLSRTGWTQLMVSTCLFARATPGAKSFTAFSANGQALALSRRNAAYRNQLAQADAIDADGQPLVIASRLLLETPLPERAATTDLFHDAARAARMHNLRFYFLGATADQVQRVSRIVHRQNSLVPAMPPKLNG